MKRNTSTWLTVLIIMIFGLNTTTIAGGLSNTNPDSSATEASWNTTTPEMAPHLVKWDANGNPVKQYRLTFEVSSGDTVYYKGDCKIDDNRVRWYPKLNQTDGDSRVVFAQKSANTANFSLYFSEGYSAREADSLYRKFPTKAENAVILANSPRSKRLARLESDVAQLTSDMTQIKAQLGDSTLVTKMEFQTELVDVWSSMETVGTFAKAADEQLSKSRGHSWTQIKRRYGLMIVHDAPKETTAAEAMPKPRSRF